MATSKKKAQGNGASNGVKRGMYAAVFALDELLKHKDPTVRRAAERAALRAWKAVEPAPEPRGEVLFALELNALSHACGFQTLAEAVTEATESVKKIAPGAVRLPTMTRALRVLARYYVSQKRGRPKAGELGGSREEVVHAVLIELGIATGDKRATRQLLRRASRCGPELIAGFKAHAASLKMGQST